MALPSRQAALLLGIVLIALTLLLCAAGTAIGSMGWEAPWSASSRLGIETSSVVVWDIRLPRSMGAWLAGALLGLSGAVAQGLFRNPLADPYLLGSSMGAALAVALLLALLGVSPAAAGVLARLGITGAAFIGAVLGVLLTLALAKGVQHTLRLLLAGVVVGMVLGAMASLVMLWVPEIMRTMQAFMLGTTGFLGWGSVAALGAVFGVSMALALLFSRALDALALGETTARSLGIPLGAARTVFIGVLGLATGAAVAQTGLIAFIGLVAPHLVRGSVRPTHAWLLPLSGLMGGVLLLGSDLLSRWLLAPRELPVGILTALLGGSYLLWLMHRRPG